METGRARPTPSSVGVEHRTARLSGRAGANFVVSFLLVASGALSLHLSSGLSNVWIPGSHDPRPYAIPPTTSRKKKKKKKVAQRMRTARTLRLLEELRLPHVTMVKVKKRASKRVKIAQREKIKKKVKEHRRKTNRDERRSTQWKSKARKDPGIPNSFPYKEQLLNEIETKRRLQEEEKLARKAEKLAERNNGEQNADEPQDGSDVEGAEDSDEMVDEDALDDMPLTAPLYRGTLQELLASDEIKTIVLALDARDPQSFRSPWLEAAVGKQKGKKLALALSRADMVPLETVAAWTAYLSSSTSLPVFPICAPSDALPENTGAEALVEKLALKGVKRGDVAVVGLAHSGRSTVADAILNAIGVPEDEDVEDEDNETSDWPAVLDTPALIPLKSSEAAEDSDAEEDEDEEEDEEDDEHKLMARMELKSMQTLMRNQGHVQRIKEPLPLTWSLMSRVSHPEDLMLIYNVPAYGSFQVERASLADEEADAEEAEKIQAAARRQKVHADTQEFLIALARATGRMKKRNIPDEIGKSGGRSSRHASCDSSPSRRCLAARRWCFRRSRCCRPPPEEDSEEDEEEIDEALLEAGDESFDDEEEEEDEEGEDEEDEAEAEQAPQKLKSILKKNGGGSKKRSGESASDDEADDDDDEQQLSRKERRMNNKKARVVVPSKSKPTPKRSSSAKSSSAKAAVGAAKAAAAATGPAPGENAAPVWECTFVLMSAVCRRCGGQACDLEANAKAENSDNLSHPTQAESGAADVAMQNAV
ncbi:hypothetical protein L1887_57718 [Cichorium endivia]|nr:hypothetical protein L1887_57718 [Cichorium endivia]